MARVAGVDLPREKRLEIALTYIYGVGRTTSKEILAATGLSADLRAKDLTDEDVSKLREYLESVQWPGGSFDHEGRYPSVRFRWPEHHLHDRGHEQRS